MSIKISIIISFFRVTLKDFSACIESLKQQTLPGIEFILINDCSPDLTIIDFVQKITESDSRFIIVQHEKNQGVSCARNSGIKCAKGEYIAFVDADDYISPMMLDEMYVVAKKNDMDIVVCNIARVENAHSSVLLKIPQHLNGKVCIYPSIDFYQAFQHISPYPVNKLFNRRCIDEFCSNYWFAEDWLFVISCSLKSKSIIIIDKILYFYVESSTSICKEKAIVI